MAVNRSNVFRAAFEAAERETAALVGGRNASEAIGLAGDANLHFRMLDCDELRDDITVHESQVAAFCDPDSRTYDRSLCDSSRESLDSAKEAYKTKGCGPVSEWNTRQQCLTC